MCGCECCISDNNIHSYLLTCRYCHLKQLKDRSHNTLNRSYGEIVSRIFETYKNSIRPHGCHIYNTSTEIDMEEMCPCPYKHQVILHCKCVLRCFYKYLSIVIPILEANIDTKTIFQEYVFMSIKMYHFFILHVRLPYEERTACSMCSAVPSSDLTEILYTGKKLVLLV